MKAERATIGGQASWVVWNDEVELAVTERGAHMAPVTFFRGSARPVQPYYISPWQGEPPSTDVPVLVPLRGDFFCMPFGGNATPFRGERHPPHGEAGGSVWTLGDSGRAGAVTRLRLTLDTAVRPGRLVRDLLLADGENVIYTVMRTEGFAGPVCYGHHANLAAPEAEGALLLSTSPFRLGLTCPHPFSVPANREYQALAQGAEIDSLERVPTIFREPAITDCSRFPVRRGYCDFIGLHDDPAPGRRSWVAAVHAGEGWLWFAVKDPSVMPARLFWMENHGRHSPPWNGRNACIGIEDGCMYFDQGLAESAGDNIVSRRGIPTCRELPSGGAFEVRYIQGVCRVPPDFGRVADVRFEPTTAVFRSDTGAEASCPVRPGFLDGEVL